MNQTDIAWVNHILRVALTKSPTPGLIECYLCCRHLTGMNLPLSNLLAGAGIVALLGITVIIGYYWHC